MPTIRTLLKAISGWKSQEGEGVPQTAVPLLQEADGGVRWQRYVRNVLEGIRSLKCLSIPGVLASLLPAKFISPFIVALAKWPVLAPLAVGGTIAFGTMDATNIQEMLTQNLGVMVQIGGAILLVLFVQNWYRFSHLVDSLWKKEWIRGVKQILALLTPITTLYLWSLFIPFYASAMFKVVVLPFLEVTSGVVVVEAGLDYTALAKANAGATLFLLVAHGVIFLYTYHKVYQIACSVLDVTVGLKEPTTQLVRSVFTAIKRFCARILLRLPRHTMTFFGSLIWVLVTWLIPFFATFYFPLKLGWSEGAFIGTVLVVGLPRLFLAVGMHRSRDVQIRKVGEWKKYVDERGNTKTLWRSLVSFRLRVWEHHLRMQARKVLGRINDSRVSDNSKVVYFPPAKG